MRIPAFDLRQALEQARRDWEARLAEVFARSSFILGRQVEAFEVEFAAAMGARRAVGCGNGTAAIELCLRDAGITGAKDEVLTTALTAPFTAVGIAAAGAQPRFADVHADTLQLNAEDAASRLTRRTRAIVAVHLYGQTCDLAPLAKLGPLLVQDAAQAHGALYRAKPLAAWSRYTTYSFYPTKNLGALGDGGAIATNHLPTAARLAARRDGGRAPGSTNMLASMAGINSRLDEIQAAYLRAFLPRLKEWTSARARIAALYREMLASCPAVQLLKESPGGVHHLFPILVARRDKLRAALAERSIGTGVHYPVPLHLHPAFAGCGLRRGDLPVSERAARRLVSLPLWPHLPLDHAAEVAEAVVAFYKR